MQRGAVCRGSSAAPYSHKRLCGLGSGRIFPPVLVLFLFLFVLGGCSSSRKVARIDANTVTDLSGNWNDTDSRSVAESAVNELSMASWVDDFRQAQGRTPTVIVGRITNRSYEHIDVTTFIKDLERSLLNEGRLKFVAGSREREQVRDERVDQAREASEETQKGPGQEVGADFMLIGNISSIVDKEGGESARYYQVNLELVNIATNEKVWIGEKKIKKIVRQDRYKF